VLMVVCLPVCSGTMTQAEIEASYRIGRRIEAEERSLESATIVFTSTKQVRRGGPSACLCHVSLSVRIHQPTRLSGGRS
jgi:hypothetical protein